MAIAYQYDSGGYYVGEIEDYGLLPNNAARTAPTIQDGYVPRWTGSAWEQVENHKGEQGYLNGQPYTIIDYGPYPDGWSTEPPAPTQKEEYYRRLAEIERKYLAPWDGNTAGRIIEISMRKGAPLDDPEYQQAVQDKAAELLALDQEFGLA